MANRWGNNGNSDRLYVLGLQNHWRWWLQAWNKKTRAPCKQFSSVTQSYPNLWDPVDCSTPGFLSISNSRSLLKLISIELVMPSNLSPSVIPFSSRLQYFPASGSFPMSQFFASGGQSIGASALASVLPMNIQDWSPLGWIGWSPFSPKDSQESSPTPQLRNIILWCSAFFMVQLSHPYVD